MLKFQLTKREKITVASVILSFGLLSTQLVPFYLTYKFIIGLGFLAYILSIFSLWEGLNKTKAVVLMILPTLITLAVASYYFLLPVRWLTRLPVSIGFGLIFYTILLSQNIFNISSIRTIPLYRAASTVSLILTILTASLLFMVIFSLKLFFLWNGLLVFMLCFVLVLQVLWSIKMEDAISVEILVYSLVLALLMGELGVVISFWPIIKEVASVVLTAALFIFLGISSDVLRGRLKGEVVWEYVGWGVLILIIATFTTSWVG